MKDWEREILRFKGRVYLVTSSDGSWVCTRFYDGFKVRFQEKIITRLEVIKAVLL